MKNKELDCENYVMKDDQNRIIMHFDERETKNKKTQTSKRKQINQQHDWLSKVGENYVAYLFSRDDDFEVFGSGAWDADCAVRDKKTNRWFRIEVKTSNKKSSLKEIRGKARRRLNNQNDKYDILCFVSFKDDKIYLELYRKDGSKKVNPAVKELREFIL